MANANSILPRAAKGDETHLRKIKDSEVVIEHDRCTREEGLVLLELTEKKLGTHYQYEVYDHGGKSPHLHIKNIQGLADLTDKQRRLWKQAFIKRYAGDPDRADYTLASKGHLIAKEGAQHFKALTENKEYGVKALLRTVNETVVNRVEELPIVEERRGSPPDTRDIIQLVREHGIEVSQTGQALCVFHKDTRPSMHLYASTATCYCFGCHAWANYDLLKAHLEHNMAVDTTLLKDPDLLNILTREVAKKVAGDEVTVKLLIICACSMYVIDTQQKPNLMLSSQSSSGKSHITKSVCGLFSRTGRYEMYSKITPQALSYLHAGETNWTWNGKLLYIEDAQQQLMSSETFKVFISDGLEQMASVKDHDSQVVRISGKPTIFTTTANIDLNDEMSNRFITVNVDESSEQIRRVLDYQARVAATGTREQYNPAILLPLKGLKEYRVLIPFAELLKRTFYKDFQRVKRDFPRFLSMIEAHAALHQYQRQVNESGRIVATPEDYEAVRGLYQVKVLDAGNFYGLSHKEKKALDLCKSYCDKHDMFGAAEIAAAHPVVSPPTWRRWLQKLTTLGLLHAKQIDAWSEKPRAMYTIGNPAEIVLPPLNHLNQENQALEKTPDFEDIEDVEDDALEE